MKEITLTINGTQVKGLEGSTVLDVCRANAIEVPTLCHLEGLSDAGACRLCVVEIEKASVLFQLRGVGLSPRARPAPGRCRRERGVSPFMLELIFTERNHFCMFCEKSGDCELQDLAYRYQMDNVRYPYTSPPSPWTRSARTS